jgi:3'-5' exonuclease
MANKKKPPGKNDATNDLAQNSGAQNQSQTATDRESGTRVQEVAVAEHRAESPKVSAQDWAKKFVNSLKGSLSVSVEYRAILETQLTRFSTDTTCMPVGDPTQPTIIRDIAALEKVSGALSAAPAVVIDLETSSLDHRQGEIVGIGFAISTGAFYIPVAHRFEESRELLPDQIALATVAEVIRLDQMPLVAHNAKFEFKWLRRHLDFTPRFVWDTLLAAALIRSDQPAGLKEAAQRELDVPDWALSTPELERIQFLPIDKVARYCAKDVWYTLELMRRQQACLS